MKVKTVTISRMIEPYSSWIFHQLVEETPRRVVRKAFFRHKKVCASTSSFFFLSTTSISIAQKKDFKFSGFSLRTNKREKGRSEEEGKTSFLWRNWISGLHDESKQEDRKSKHSRKGHERSEKVKVPLSGHVKEATTKRVGRLINVNEIKTHNATVETLHNPNK